MVAPHSEVLAMVIDLLELAGRDKWKSFLSQLSPYYPDYKRVP
jgi:hypothetical protein